MYFPIFKIEKIFPCYEIRHHTLPTFTIILIIELLYNIFYEKSTNFINFNSILVEYNKAGYQYNAINIEDNKVLLVCNGVTIIL